MNKNSYLNRVYLIVLISLISLVFFNEITAAENKNILTVDRIIGKNIILEDNFAGQSLTVLEENNRYFVLRKIFGSGVPVAASIKYNAVKESETQIKTDKITGKIPEGNKNEVFVINTGEKEAISVYLNGIKICVKSVE